MDQDLKGTAPELVQELIDLRLVHHIKSRVTVGSHPGKVYRALLLYVSQYTGERKRRDLEMIDFWKESKKGNIRRSKYIYDPNIELKDLEKATQTQRPTGRKIKSSSPEQRGLFD